MTFFKENRDTSQLGLHEVFEVPKSLFLSLFLVFFWPPRDNARTWSWSRSLFSVLFSLKLMVLCVCERVWERVMEMCECACARGFRSSIKLMRGDRKKKNLWQLKRKRTLFPKYWFFCVSQSPKMMVSKLKKESKANRLHKSSRVSLAVKSAIKNAFLIFFSLSLQPFSSLSCQCLDISLYHMRRIWTGVENTRMWTGMNSCSFFSHI